MRFPDMLFMMKELETKSKRIEKNREVRCQWDITCTQKSENSNLKTKRVQNENLKSTKSHINIA